MLPTYVRRLWRRLFGKLRTDEFVVTGGFGEIELDNDAPTRIQKELGRLMGEAIAGHPWEECEERGCKQKEGETS